ncbi:JEN1 [Brettanomyces bruxellensis]|uniref:DEBR0S1_28282g1_1 n=1 Tax=Dekkera bruxellensis TaxID=5007 RepID=A0A7D9CXC6_DEKBR|nr:JEN1 [Brettanomyces bruxellensis]
MITTNTKKFNTPQDNPDADTDSGITRTSTISPDFKKTASKCISGSEQDELQLNLTWPSIRRYLITRLTDLIPSKKNIRENKGQLNPLKGLSLIKGKQSLMILSAFLGWSWVAYDFFTISMNITELSKQFGKSVKDITWGITLVLMLRSVGSIIFGYLGDRYGRKWPLILNLLLVCFLEIGTGFVQTYQQFLGVRAVFGILLGGVYGNAAATALDDCPMEARGIVSGFLQQGYTFGYLMAVVLKRAIADNSSKHWRAMFWFGSGVMFIIVIFRTFLPETKAFHQAMKATAFNRTHGIQEVSFIKKAVSALKSYWLMVIYLVLLMAGFNFMSHGSQDLYPTLLTVRYSFSEDKSTVTNCVANIGAMCGGIIIAHLSNFAGRRLSIIICCIAGGALIYPWAFVSSSAINAGAFFLQFFIQGAWGIVPVHLSELAPPSFRSFVVGLAYQLGNLTSAASSTIESTLGERFPMISPSGKHIYDYAKVMAIFVGCVFVYVVFITFIGPERRNMSFEMADKQIKNKDPDVDEFDQETAVKYIEPSSNDEEANIGISTH